MRKTFYSNSIYIFTLLLIPLGIGFLSLTLGQDTNWDLQNYHLYNPYAYLNGRINQDLAPAGAQSYFNPFIDILYYQAINLCDAKLVGFGLGFLQGLNFIVIFFISRNVINPLKHGAKLSFFLAISGVLTVAFLSEIGTTFHDSLTAIFSLSSLLIITSNISSIYDNKNKGIVITLFAGAIVGFGTGLKLVVLIFAVALFLSFFTLTISWQNRLKFAIVFGFGIVLGWLVTGGYWAYLIWQNFGNPLFPFFNNIFHGDFAPYESIRDDRFLPKSLLENIFYPIIFTLDPNRVGELKYIQYSWLSVFIAIVAFLVARLFTIFSNKFSLRPLTPNNRFVICYFCFAYLLWLNTFGIYRYLTSIELLTPLILFLIVIQLLKSKWTALIAVVFIGILTIVNLRGVVDWGRAGWANPVVRLEQNELNTNEPSAIFLGGQPLAWVIPPLSAKTPFIQAVPNFPVTNQYWKRAETLLANRTGKLFIILESDAIPFLEAANKGLMNIDLIVNSNSCRPFDIYLGTKRFNYKYCEVLKLNK